MKYDVTMKTRTNLCRNIGVHTKPLNGVSIRKNNGSFSCGQCGEALKKNKVELHYQWKCRSCNFVSCIDCGKDFWGNEYEKHTQCISEEEKYSGKNYVAKQSANKGEVKQQQWIEQVQSCINKVKANPQLRNILERIKHYPNIPRKKTKFENFLKSSLRIHSPYLISQVWDLIMANTEKPTPVSNGVTEQSKTNGQSTESVQAISENSEKSSEDQSHVTEDMKKLNKRERKEERRKQHQKVEKKHKHTNEVQNDSENDLTENKKVKRKKKRKHEETEEMDTPNRKRNRSEDCENGVLNTDLDETIDEPQSDESEKKRYKTKFNWTDVILEVLKKKGEISVKKLRKKVLAEYLSQGCTEKSEEKLWAKFEKKLKKNPTFKVQKDRVKLVT